jgi:hypothetical protein
MADVHRLLDAQQGYPKRSLPSLPSLMRCLNGWRSTHSAATSMHTPVIIKFLFFQMTKVRLPSPVPTARSPTSECRLVFAMHLLHFKGDDGNLL